MTEALDPVLIDYWIEEVEKVKDFLPDSLKFRFVALRDKWLTGSLSLRDGETLRLIYEDYTA